MPEIFALASYNKSSACYLDPRAQLLCVLEGQKGWESVQDLNFWWHIQTNFFLNIPLNQTISTKSTKIGQIIRKFSSFMIKVTKNVGIEIWSASPMLVRKSYLLLIYTLMPCPSMGPK